MFYIVILIVALIALQIALSMQKNKFLGLILPAVTVIMIITTLTVKAMKTSILLAVVLALFLAIYFFYQKKVKQKSENDISKMKINDL